MGLPKLDQPLFPITIPSTNKKTTFRPFTVKEEKILLIAQESKDTDHLTVAIKQLIENCVSGVKVDALTVFDLEYLLLKIRAKSADNIVKFSFVDDETEEKVLVELDLDKIEVQKNPKHNKVLDLTDNIKLVMKYPDISFISKQKEYPTESEKAFAIMTSCIDSVVQGEEVYKMNDFSEEDQQEFIESLNGSALSKIREFFETMPKVRHVHKYKNKDGKDKTYVVEGLESFFT